MVGVDSSNGAMAAVEWALSYSSRDDVVILLHTWSVTAAGGYEIGYPYMGDVEEAARKLVDDLAEEFGSADGPRVEGVVEHGHAGSHLIEAARDADLLVVDRRGHGGFRGLLIGSVSTYVVHHASCPVVVVTDPEHSG